MPSSEASDALETQSAENHALVLRQLERILAHTSFRNSQRYRTFLRYVVEERLQGNTVHLKERMIGVSVFHQPLDYDTNANAVVRVTAGEIRRRLAQYYREASPDDEVLIELPIGGYVPEFRLRETTILPSVAARSIEITPRPFGASLSNPERPLAVSAPQPTRWYASRSALLAVITLLILGFGGLLWWHLRAPHANQTEADRILAGAFGRKDVLLVAGPQGWDVTDKSVSRPDSGFSYTTTRTAAIIGSAIGHAGGRASLLPMQDTRLENMQQSPAVLIGAFNNEWTLRLQSPLRYQFVRVNNTTRGIVDTKDPSAKPILDDPNSSVGYGILAHFHSASTGQSTMIAGGLGMHGTAAARIFLSSPELLEAFAKSAPRGWENGNYEIVLASDSVNNLADPPKVVHAEFW